MDRNEPYMIPPVEVLEFLKKCLNGGYYMVETMNLHDMATDYPFVRTLRDRGVAVTYLSNLLINLGYECRGLWTFEVPEEKVPGTLENITEMIDKINSAKDRQS